MLFFCFHRPWLRDYQIDKIIHQIICPSPAEVLIEERKRKVENECPYSITDDELCDLLGYAPGKFLVPEPSQRKELNDIDSLKVAFRLSKELVIRNLGLHLGIESYILDTIFQNKRYDKTGAAHDALQEWRKRQPIGTEAYQNLLEVLTLPDVNLLHIAHEVFGEPVMNNNANSESG